MEQNYSADSILPYADDGVVHCRTDILVRSQKILGNGLRSLKEDWIFHPRTGNLE